ncbi:MAG: acyltransferase [Woeseiaceae bacterium]|nr:acyltransferase [Woeseiaceae bacterium]
MLLDDNNNRAVVDFLRGAGILLVIGFHVVIGMAVLLLESGGQPQYIEALPAVMNVFWQALGSELIFLASGFLLSYLLIRELRNSGRISVRDFYIRRGSRIVPMYLIAIALYALVRDFEPWELIVNLLFVSKWFDAETIIPVGWSLEVLVQAYLLLPWVVMLLYRIGRPVLLCLLGLAIALSLRAAAQMLEPSSYQVLPHELIGGVEPTQTQDDLYYLLWFRLTPFLLGLLLAHLVVHEQERFRRWFSNGWLAVTVVIIGIALIVVSGFLPIQDSASFVYSWTGEAFWLWFWTLQRLVFAMGCCMLAVGLWYSKLPAMAPLEWLAQRRIWGRLSAGIYSIYLFHPIFLIPSAVIGFRATAVEQLGNVHVLEILAVIVLTAAMSLLLAMLLTRFVELPAQRWIRARLGRA